MNTETSTLVGSISGAIEALNTHYRLAVQDGTMTEKAWDDLTDHLLKIELVIKALETK